jgi:hypothetical protein
MKRQFLVIITTLTTLMMNLSFVGCGPGTNVRDTGEYESYVQAFEKDSLENGYAVQVNYLVIKNGSLPANQLALCDTGVGVPTITVNPEYWAIMNELERTIVMYHELGHCVFFKVHVNTQLDPNKGRAYVSIMNAYPLDLYDFETYRAQYMKEFFNPLDDQPH